MCGATWRYPVAVRAECVGANRRPLSGLFLSMLLGCAGCGALDDAAQPSAASGGHAGSDPGGTGQWIQGGQATAGGQGGQANHGGSSVGTSTTAPDMDRVDVVEKGLCKIRVGCDAAIIDTPPVQCTFELADESGTKSYVDYATMNLRGRSSIKFPKKNYALELCDAAGQEHPANLLQTGQESDWILDGAWADRSFMRNRLTFALYREMDESRWAPQARYCELELNGSNAGIYVLVEKIKRDDDRIKLPEDDGTGATFIVRQDDLGTLNLSIGAGSKWQVVYPSGTHITAEQTQAVQAWLDRLGTAMRSTEPSDLLKLLDPAAMIDWILVQELAKNIDAYNLSLYFVRNAGGLAWPVPWDIDLAYGQPTLRDGDNELPQGWVHTRTVLITQLSADPTIRAGLGTRWRALRTGLLSDAAITARLDAYAALLDPAALTRNFALWPIEDVDFVQYYAPYSFYDVTSYDEELSHLRSWIKNRLTWIDANIDQYPSK